MSFKEGDIIIKNNENYRCKVLNINFSETRKSYTLSSSDLFTNRVTLDSDYVEKAYRKLSKLEKAMR